MTGHNFMSPFSITYAALLASKPWFPRISAVWYSSYAKDKQTYTSQYFAHSEVNVALSGNQGRQILIGNNE